MYLSTVLMGSLEQSERCVAQRMGFDGDDGFVQRTMII